MNIMLLQYATIQTANWPQILQFLLRFSRIFSLFGHKKIISLLIANTQYCGQFPIFLALLHWYQIILPESRHRGVSSLLNDIIKNYEVKTRIGSEFIVLKCADFNSICRKK